MWTRLASRMVTYSAAAGLLLSLLTFAILTLIEVLRLGHLPPDNYITLGGMGAVAQMFAIFGFIIGLMIGMVNTVIFILISRIGFYPPPTNPDIAKRYRLWLGLVISIFIGVGTFLWCFSSIKVYDLFNWLGVILCTLIWSGGFYSLSQIIAKKYLASASIPVLEAVDLEDTNPAAASWFTPNG